MLEFECRNTGFDCSVIFAAKTEEELDEQIAKHALEVHGVGREDFTPELMRKIKANIHRV